MGKFIDLTGQRFGRLVVVSRADNSGYGKVMWLCQCDCGSKPVVVAGNLRSGTTQSCGCVHREKLGELNRTHGLSRSRIYYLWHGMRTRCNNENCASYIHYGGRGITVCPE